MQVDQRGVSADTAAAPHGHIHIDRDAGVGNRERAAHGFRVAAVAAAAADGLRQHAVRALAVGAHQAIAGERHVHFLAIAPAAARGANRHRRPDREYRVFVQRHGQGDATRHGAATGAAAAADRLGKYSVGIGLRDRLARCRRGGLARHQAARIDLCISQRHGYLGSVAAKAATAAYRHGQAESQIQSRRLSGAAAAATAADRLGNDARGGGAIALQACARRLDRHRARRTTRARRSADRQGNRIHQGHVGGRAAAAATAANRLRQHRGGAIAQGRYRTVVVDE
ncbi:hypothetical protein D3C71_1242330 [compost metagenome]